MDWMKIGSALLLGMMLIFLWPRAKQMFKESPKAESGDWKAVIIPLLAVIGFVILLVMMV